MTDTPELASLTIKDLRQLAGEHNIANRSRLGKDELIQALQEAMASSGRGQPAQDQHPAEAQASAAAASAHASSRQPVDSLDDDGDDEVDAGDAPDADDEVGTAPTAADVDETGGDDADDADEEAGLEDEDIDAEAAQPISRAPLPSGGEPEEITAESMALLAGQDQRPQQQQSELPWPANLQGGEDEEGGEGGRRRRRRRRGRGRGRRDDDQFGQPGGDDGTQQQDAPQGDAQHGEASQAPVNGEAAVARPPQNHQQQRPPQPQNQRHHEQRPNDQRPNDQRPNDQRPSQDPRGQDPRGQDPRGQQHQNQQQRPPRPRIDGPQRPVPSVLDRLCTFSRGILELCSPDTPSWAQPRLSELLAEAGMVMIPVQGPAHPDYHEVVGTLATKSVPPGHVAEMVAPGFALRGDRGDLFPLRKAKVRVAEGGAPVPPPQPPRRDDDRPRDESPRHDAPSAPSEVTDEEPDAFDAGEPAPETARPDEGGGDEGGEVNQADARHEGREGRGGRDGDARRDARPDLRGPNAPRPDAGRAQPRVAPRTAPPPPAAGRPPLRTHAREPAGDAPQLPLAQQVPDELAARPKAEAFRPLGLNDQILADLAAMGYEKPTPIQEEAIPVVLSTKDMIGQAQTGTGKTAAFVLPMLQRLYSIEGEGPVALVLCPTRELARQVHGEFVKMAGVSGARAALIYGGVPMDDQVRALERKPHVVIGTPGRIIDHMRRKVLSLARLNMAVLDEADQMLDIGFWPDVNFIISHTPPSRQMLLFSATFPDPVKQLAAKHMKEPAHVRIQPKQVTVEQVDQKYIAVAREKKNELLAHFIDTQNPEQMLVFCRTKHQTDRVAEVLKRKKMSAAAIHGDLPQSKREKTLAAFRAGELQCLIATNVAARGLDIPTVSHVVNYDIPEMPEEYVHRIGRTARNGARGVARTFITPEDGQFLVEIEKHIGLLLEEERVEGFTPAHTDTPIKRTIADAPVGRILKPLVGGIRLGRRRG